MTHWTTLRNLLYTARIKKTTHIYISYRPNLHHVHVPCVSLLIILVGGIDVRPIWIIWPKIAMWVPCMYVCVCPSATSKHPLPLSVVTIHIKPLLFIWLSSHLCTVSSSSLAAISCHHLICLHAVERCGHRYPVFVWLEATLIIIRLHACIGYTKVCHMFTDCQSMCLPLFLQGWKAVLMFLVILFDFPSFYHSFYK